MFHQNENNIDKTKVQMSYAFTMLGKYKKDYNVSSANFIDSFPMNSK